MARARRITPRGPRETLVQGAIVKYLDAVLFPTHRCFAIPNAARRTGSGRAANAVPGLKPGVPDVAIVGGGLIWFLEIKRDKRAVLSEYQKDWRDWCQDAGGTPWARVESIDDVTEELRQWNIPTRDAK